MTVGNIWIFSNISISATQVDGCYHLKTFLNIAGPDVLSVGAGPEAQSVLKRMEREATHRYQTLTLPEDRAANCIFVNGSLVHRGRQEAPKSQPVSELFTLVLCNRIGISLSNHSFWLVASLVGRTLEVKIPPKTLIFAINQLMMLSIFFHVT